MPTEPWDHPGVRTAMAVLGGVTVVLVLAACSGEEGGTPHAAPATSSSSAPGSPTIEAPVGPGTKVVTVVAVGPDGEPAAGWTVDGPGGEVDCSYGASLATVGEDILFCSPSAAGADVCWLDPDRVSVLCGTDPWERRLLPYRATAPVPATAAPDVPEPWALELSNGARCRLRNGGAWGGRADDLVGAYYCDGESSFVLMPASGEEPAVDQSSPMWTVQVGELGLPQETFPPPTRVSVVTAYFAGR